MTNTVLTETVEGGVRIVTLNRPQRLNAIVPELLEDLIAALRAGDGNVRCNPVLKPKGCDAAALRDDRTR